MASFTPPKPTAAQLLRLLSRNIPQRLRGIAGAMVRHVGFTDTLDAHRVLVGRKDRLGHVEQLRQLYADGDDGVVLFEPFSRRSPGPAQPDRPVRESINLVRARPEVNQDCG